MLISRRNRGKGNSCVGKDGDPWHQAYHEAVDSDQEFISQTSKAHVYSLGRKSLS
jgi:hypothetical protein